MRIEFKERDRQWLVTLTHADGVTSPGEPFPASGHEHFSKLEQVLFRLGQLGYRPKQIPSDKPDALRYVIEVEPV